MKTKSYKFIVMLAILLGSASTEIKAGDYSAFFTKVYTTRIDVAKDLEKGKLALVSNINILQFINMQLSGWNEQLITKKVKMDDGKFFQLKSNFASTKEAIPYFCDLLRKNCKDENLVWSQGDYLISRVHKKTGQIDNNFIRANYANEVVVVLITSSFEEVSDADGAIGQPDLYGFSLACGNKLSPKKVEEKQKEQKKEFQRTETETDIVVDDKPEKPCTEWVWKNQRRLITETHKTGIYYAGIGDFSGSRGNRMPSESVTTQYYDEQLVLVEQPCGTTIEEELPIASNEEYEEAKVATREGRPFYIVLNVGGQFNFSKAGNYSGSGNTGGGGTFQPKTPGGQGGGFTPKTPGGGGGTFTPRTPGRRGG